MYFALGLLTAGLLGLMIAPAVWRRAVRLTRTRIERSVPLTLAEIQADKDQLRAEFAMSTRRLEMSVERLKEKAAEQLIEINRKRELISRLTNEHTGRADTLKRLEAHEADLRERLRAKEESLANTTAEFSNLEVRLAERNHMLLEMEKRIESLNQVSAEKTVELVARGTELDNLRDELTRDRATFRNETADITARLDNERRNAQALESRLVRIEAERDEVKAVMERREKELAELRSELAQAQSAHGSVDNKLAEAEAARIEAEAAVARLTLALERESHTTANDAIQSTLAAVQDEKDSLVNKVTELEDRHQQLQAENAELRRITGEDWETERRENALLRERLNDIAGKVANLTKTVAPEAADDTPLEPPPPRRRPRARVAKAEREAVAALAEAEAEPGKQTLADRVRGLQRPAN
jgi:chromosome segregation ATPase